MSILIQILAGLYVLAVTVAVLGLAYFLALDRGSKIWAEIELLKSQAAHVDQTKAAEALNSEKLVKSYEQQGANKLRTEIARLGGDLAKIEEKLGSKIKAVANEAHVALVTELGARITALEAEIARATCGIPNDAAGSGTTSVPVAPSV